MSGRVKPLQGWEPGIVPEWAMALIGPVTDTGCWPWTGQVRGEYGVVRLTVPGRMGPIHPVQAHRFIYELLLGRMPQSARDRVTAKSEPIDLDHLCRNTRCVNPAHMEPVTRSENLRRRDAARRPI